MDATLGVSIAALAVALVALAVSMYAIRRDAPALHLSMGDAAAGSRYLLVVNVGLRPVRLEGMMVRPVTWRRRWERAIQVPHSVLGGHFRRLESFGQDVNDRRLVVVLQPGDDVLLQVSVMASQEAMASPRGFEIVAVDAAGHRYALSSTSSTHWGPEPTKPNNERDTG